MHSPLHTPTLEDTERKEEGKKKEKWMRGKSGGKNVERGEVDGGGKWK